MKKSFPALIAVFLLFLLMANVVHAQEEWIGLQELESTSKTSAIDSWITKNMKDGKIPGASVVIVHGDKTVYHQGFGYADKEKGTPVTADTLFELGSNSKAFTALGILQLAERGLINLNDPVKKYIPWFEMRYKGIHNGKKMDAYVEITLEQLLHHTSGIPYKSIANIPIAQGNEALDSTVRMLVGKQLDFYPGDKFQYVTINYDILGLVIQKVTGETFEDYMTEALLRPANLKHTYLSRNESVLEHLATGYKVGFLRSEPYAAPIYRGNAPAGYFITNSQDLERWIKLQLNSINDSSLSGKLIELSHNADRTVGPSPDGSSYAAGWFVFQEGGGKIAHGGSNPNYSSYIILKPDEEIGIGILTNLNSSYTEAMAKGVMDILQGEKPQSNVSDTYINIDRIAFAVILVSAPIMIITVWLLIVFAVQTIQRKRKFNANLSKVLRNLLFYLIFLFGFAYCLYIMPDALFDGLPWGFIKVWGPPTLPLAIFMLFAAVALFCGYFFLTTLSPRNDRALFIISIISIASGLGNAIIIFIINETLGRNDGFQKGLLFFFVLGTVIYVFGQRIVRLNLLRLTNQLVFSKRTRLIECILNASYEKIDHLESGAIHSGLNNDTEIISNFSNVVITAVTGVITLFCCFIYLGLINFYGLLFSIAIIFIAAGFYFAMGRYANRLWEETRDIQNVFFKFINSLLEGYKELKLHSRKRNEFRQDMQGRCEEYRDKRVKGDLGFANVFVIGELLFTLVIGVTAFAFPVLFDDIKVDSLRGFVFVFLYMTGPIHGVLNSIPEIIRVRISYKRLIGLEHELGVASDENTYREGQFRTHGPVELELVDVKYTHKASDEALFHVGPISCRFRSGEITFITGGNGSGKSTLAKLITGLYEPDEGHLQINKEIVDHVFLGENFSVVFSDFHIFNELYGIDIENDAEIAYYLEKLQLTEKVSISQGEFSSVKLSTGQRKRLALLLAYLEDRPIFLFDEWAADQDPEFRKYFYEVLLPELKRRNKCIIAITHDDRYFYVADQLLKMDMGTMVESVGSLR
ncbi:cyclic peptide export ABC transporter [Paenibacillus sp. HN-1]|uniref:cyclic peptide export ABC transporter n=1 Tax=Paenibacillus TaxID=44249 RepID=UPI001CA84FB0|nr:MULTISPECIES: cyclic peptide export ABC transporter [Paenibacillus]MBY9077382.1 cyclic peptide export ABC transporter [Paenibacillus sp. CGMCC 1.18879]MBY9087510.1 cyclic peptide export ABC transporter [Paenibacillus sinensis]